MARRTTIADISREAGVGIATVSRALADHPDVSAATRDRVREVARRLQYRPSVSARALRQGGFHAISLVVPDAGWGWWEPTVRAAARAAFRAGYQLLVHPIAGAEGGLSAAIEGLRNVPTEGVIVVSVPDQAGVGRACSSIPLPAIAIDDTAHALHFPTVSPKNRDGARQATRHLIERGSRRIAFATIDSSSSPSDWGEGLYSEERFLGYRDALREADLPFDPRLIFEYPGDGFVGLETSVNFDALLAPDVAVDAVFCVADQLAPVLYRSLLRAGLRIPDDVRVAGFDDEAAARIITPQLTTVRQPYEEMGQLAVSLLLRKIEGEDLPPLRHELEVELVIRDSSD